MKTQSHLMAPPGSVGKADPVTEALRMDYEEKSEAARDLWSQFDSERKSSGIEESLAKGQKPDPAVTKRLAEMQAKYEEAAKEAESLHDQLIPRIGKTAVGTPSASRGLGDSLSNISEAFLKEHGGPERTAKAVTAGSITVSTFFDDAIRESPMRSMFVQSVMPVRMMDSGRVAYLQQTVNTNNAAPVAAGALKPTSVVTLEERIADARVIATLSEQIDRSLLQDHENLRNFFDVTLRTHVLLALEAQVISGNGTAPNLRGLLNTAGVLNQPRGTDTALDAIEIAITQVRLSFHEPTAIVIHPTNLSAIRRAKATSGEYLMAPPTQDGPERVMGLEVIASPVVPLGTAIVGDFTGATIWQREGVTVELASTGLGDTAGHELFSRNLYRARAEGRWALAVERPAAFCTVTGL